MAAKKLLLLTHGINSDRIWQDVAVGVLSRYFECEPLHYYGYRILGFFRNCFSLWLIPLTVLAFFIGSYWSMKIAILVFLVSLVLTFIKACQKRTRNLADFLQAYDEASTRHNDRSPHAIAHSFGTHLLCSALATYPGVVAFDRVVFWGSVVNAEFHWPAVIAEGGVSGVRNETSRRDYVARLAGWAFWIPEMGNSGTAGFRRGGPVVQNASFPRFRHSDAAALRKHIQESWLPFLWEISPAEYRSLLDQCARCLRTPVGGSLTASMTAAEFDNRHWSWTQSPSGNVPFRAFLEQDLHNICVAYGTIGFTTTNEFRACYPIARRIFWDLCNKHDDHPRWIVLSAAREAVETVMAGIT
jgi:hypothetical protein